jgi:hypothetical protein
MSTPCIPIEPHFFWNSYQMVTVVHFILNACTTSVMCYTALYHTFVPQAVCLCLCKDTT